MKKLVLVSPEAIEAAAVCASTEACRPNLCGLLIGPDGTITATDGHRLIQLRSGIEMAADDYPANAVPENMHAPEAYGVIVPAKVAKEAAKAGRKVKHPAIPGLRAVAVSVNEVSGQMTSTDLDTTAKAEFKPLAGPYPNVDCVYPKDEAAFTISFNAKLLAETLTAFCKAHESDFLPQVNLTFYSALKPVLIENSDGSAKGLVMPVRK